MVRTETLIIGGGQAGLAMSYHLTSAGRPHVVLERAERVASAWRGRWDSFALVTPNFQVRMPGAEYTGPEPYGFMSRAQVVDYLETYARRFHLPVRCQVEATSIERDGDEYRVRTNLGEYQATNVVVATGMYQAPNYPPLATALPPHIRQLHTMHYRNPHSVSAGAVLVVGTGQSGVQIAEELNQSGRTVYLSVGSGGRVPRRYRGRDINDWFTRLGLFDAKVHDLATPAAKFAAHPQISGKNGGSSLNLHQFARDGVRLLGRALEARQGKIILAPDLHEKLEAVDRFEADALRMIDDYIERRGLRVPPESVPQLRDGYEQPLTTELDLAASQIETVLWATGYKFDYSIVHLPVVDADGYPLQERGKTRYRGLYFLGMPWLYSRRSGLLFGVGDDAAYLAADILGATTKSRGDTTRLTCGSES